MKNKKAFMLGEYTLKIIIAVLCLLLLFYLLFSLYSNSKDERRKQLAEASLEDVEEKMVLARESGNVQSIALLNPEASPLGYWNDGEQGPESPKECNKNCLCLCTGTWSRTAILGERVVICNVPICKNFDEKLFIEGDSILEIPRDIEVEYKEGTYIFRPK